MHSLRRESSGVPQGGVVTLPAKTRSAVSFRRPATGSAQTVERSDEVSGQRFRIRDRRVRSTPVRHLLRSGTARRAPGPAGKRRSFPRRAACRRFQTYQIMALHDLHRQSFRKANGAAILCTVLLTPSVFAQTDIPAWCRPLPRVQYRGLERIPVRDAWFEVYRVAPGVFAIYEPHQFEETISYLIAGEKEALLFDTGMGISDIQKVTAELTKLPIVVLNSHTHNDHVGGNWQFETIYGMDTAFTRANARGSREDAQAEVAPGEICGALPKGFDRKAYVTKPWKIKAIQARWRSHRFGRPVAGDHRHARPHAGCRVPSRSRPWPALHRRHLLSRSHLALPSRNRSRCLWRLDQTACRAGAAGQDRSRRSQHSRCAALGASPAGIRLRGCSRRQGSPGPGIPGKVLYQVEDISFLMAAPPSKF